MHFDLLVITQTSLHKTSKVAFFSQQTPWFVIKGKAQVLLKTLTMALLYSNVPAMTVWEWALHQHFTVMYQNVFSEKACYPQRNNRVENNSTQHNITIFYRLKRCRLKLLFTIHNCWPMTSTCNIGPHFTISLQH